MKEFPVTDEVEAKDVAAHTVVDAGGVEDELELEGGWDLFGATEGLGRGVADLTVENDEGRVIGKEGLRGARKGAEGYTWW